MCLITGGYVLKGITYLTTRVISGTVLYGPFTSAIEVGIPTNIYQQLFRNNIFLLLLLLVFFFFLLLFFSHNLFLAVFGHFHRKHVMNHWILWISPNQLLQDRHDTYIKVRVGRHATTVFFFKGHYIGV